MQLFQESEVKLNSRLDHQIESQSEQRRSSKEHPPITVTAVVNDSSPKESESKEKDASLHREREDVYERPKTLKFLAASAAFQSSTVPALKRLPYTPDPDWTLCDGHENTDHSPIKEEAEDKVAPLQPPPRTRMFKPKGGLLERRGSNVNLTICLQHSKENNTSAKSPKPLAYLQRASSPLTPNELHAKACDTRKLQQEFWEIPMNHPPEKHFNVAGHGTKNRYRSILPNQHSRVQLPSIPGEDTLSTYINANYIRDCTEISPPPPQSDEENIATPVTRENATFIATQGPLTNTIVDFWRMIWQEESSAVIMLTKLKERKEKCAPYLPSAVDESVTFEDVTIKLTTLKQYEHFSVRTLEVIRDGETRSINHYWYTTWMDHETPEKTRGLLELVQEVSLWNKTHHGPMVVHCSAGIGRTGCYIAVTTGCQQLSKTKKADILRIVSQMRLDRGGMIQTWEQYQFVHQALSRYARILAGENVTTPSTTGSIRSPPTGPTPKNTVPKDTPQNPEPARPATPKQRRSFSEMNLPSPKELKLKTKTSAPTSSCDNNVQSTNSTERIRSGKRKPKPRAVISLEPPTTPLPDGITSPQLAIVKSVSSPTIRSPFSRMCLQVKDLNAGRSPVQNAGKFEFPETQPCAEPTEKNSNLINSPSQPNENQVNGFNFSAVNGATEPSGSPKFDCKIPHLKSTQKRQFAFELPAVNTNSLNKLNSNGHDNGEDTGKDQNTPDANLKTSTPTAKINSQFVFPTPAKR
ncbi:uncharacterized protein LOC143445058 isoform X2 [Clavelina lepadiformis]